MKQASNQMNQKRQRKLLHTNKGKKIHQEEIQIVNNLLTKCQYTQLHKVYPAGNKNID
jgi:hypothetical protein